MTESPDRRQFLKLSGVTTALALAGCSQTDSGPGEDGGSPPGGTDSGPDGGTTDGSSETENLTPLTVDESWPSYRADSSNTGHTTNAGPGSDLEVRWTSTDVHARGGFVLAEGTVFVGSYLENSFVAFDAASGREQWRFEPSGPVVASPEYTDGTIVFPTKSGTMYALDAADGTEQWQLSAGRYATPTAVDGTLFVPDEPVLAVDAASGETLWEHSITESPWGYHPVAVADDTVYLSDNEWGLYAIDSESGETVWETTLGEGAAPATGTMPLIDGSGDDSGQRTIYLSNGTQFTAVDAASGEKRWTYETPDPVDQPAALADGTVILLSGAGNMHALDAATGEQQWTKDLFGSLTDPVVADGTVYVMDKDTVLYALDVATGDEQGQFEIDPLGHDSPAIASGVIFVATNEGVVALQSADAA